MIEHTEALHVIDVTVAIEATSPKRKRGHRFGSRYWQQAKSPDNSV